jgi:hypothetical protein
MHIKSLTTPKPEQGTQTVLFEIAKGMRASLAVLRPNFKPNNKLLAISARTGTGSKKWPGIVWQGNASKTAESI